MSGESPLHSHRGEAAVRLGAEPGAARAGVILVHGRGATAADILGLVPTLDAGPDVVFLAPQAAGGSWYPQSFLAPVARNEPGRSSALAVLEKLFGGLIQEGITPERVLLVGFSQGACLATEFLARAPRRYGGLAALTGGLIGADEDLEGFSGDLGGSPIYLGSGDPDFHVPWTRVERSAEILRGLGGGLAVERYPGHPHAPHPRGLEWIRKRLRDLAAAS